MQGDYTIARKRIIIGKSLPHYQQLLYEYKPKERTAMEQLKSKEQLLQELAKKTEEFWNASDALNDLRLAVAGLRNAIQGMK